MTTNFGRQRLHRLPNATTINLLVEQFLGDSVRRWFPELDGQRQGQAKDVLKTLYPYSLEDYVLKRHGYLPLNGNGHTFETQSAAYTRALTKLSQVLTGRHADEPEDGPQRHPPSQD